VGVPARILLRQRDAVNEPLADKTLQPEYESRTY
jgi:hypothetical protein